MQEEINWLCLFCGVNILLIAFCRVLARFLFKAYSASVSNKNQMFQGIIFSEKKARYTILASGILNVSLCLIGYWLLKKQ